MDNADTLFESNNKNDLKALSAALDIKEPGQWMRCMCIGDPAIFVYQDDELLVLITNHHAQTIRVSIWDTDVFINDTEKWLNWFDARDITGPRKEMLDAEIRAIERQARWERWKDAVPSVLRKPLMDYEGDLMYMSTQSLHEKLAEKLPTKHSQILALLHWFGSGTGRWSGYPTYETVTENMLLDHDLADILTVLQLPELSAEQLEGAARLLVFWDFPPEDPNGQEQIPVEIKQRLWEHIKYTNDEDKLGRASKAFKPKEL